MDERRYFKSKVFSQSREASFEDLALQIFRYQYASNPVYQKFVQALGIDPAQLNRIEQIPHLPIALFKSHRIQCGEEEADKVFSSSGTTGQQRSKHYVPDLSLYEESFTRAWQHFYPPIKDFCVLALLPSYLEREGSSLIYMADHFIRESLDTDSGFYLDQWDELHAVLLQKIAAGKPTLLLGVTFALLELAERYQLPGNNLIVMETGGMKGRRKEMIRSAVHDQLKAGLGVEQVHSEYGMTELLSQAYSQGEGLFYTPPWMRVSIRQTDDPLSAERLGKTGGLNVIDLANIGSCAFIATEDLARLHSDGRFEVMGRFDNADIRGCNLMVI